jgi:hypothetical protein
VAARALHTELLVMPSETNQPPDSRAAPKHRRVRYAGRPPSDDDIDAYSIAEFCRRHGLSESFFFKLRARGEGPAMIAVGTRRLITREAAKAWRKRYTDALHP